MLRSGPADWCSFGIGQFVFGWQGDSLLILLHGKVFEDLGIPLHSVRDRIHRMSEKDLKGIFYNRAVAHATLRRNVAVWVPYGWVPLCFAGLTSSKTTTVRCGTLPFYSDALCGEAGTVMSSFLAAIDAAFESVSPDQRGQYRRDTDPVATWLEQALGVEAAPPASEAAADEGPSAASEGDAPKKRARLA